MTPKIYKVSANKQIERRFLKNNILFNLFYPKINF